MPGDNRYETGSLLVSGLPGGCSVVWLPPERTTTGTPMLTRDFDFSPWTLHQFLGGMRRTLTAHAASELAVIGWRFTDYWLPIRPPPPTCPFACSAAL
jgi:hypothetical protein